MGAKNGGPRRVALSILKETQREQESILQGQRRVVGADWFKRQEQAVVTLLATDFSPLAETLVKVMRELREWAEEGFSSRC